MKQPCCGAIFSKVIVLESFSHYEIKERKLCIRQLYARSGHVVSADVGLCLTHGLKNVKGHVVIPSAKGNENNSDYFRANFLQKKIDGATSSDKTSPPIPPKSRLKSGLPLEVVQEVFSLQHIIIIEYFWQLLFKRFQDVLKGQVVVNTGKARQLPPVGVSRCDRL